MTRREVLHPPRIVEVDGPVIFLAGPIQDAPNWQFDAKSIIHQLDPRVTVASPRKNYVPGEFVYENQVDWETHYLQRAAKMGSIIFFLALQATQKIEDNGFPRPYAQTTRQELGEWRVRKEYEPSINLVVGIEKGFPNERYIRRRLGQDTPNVPIFDNLPETCAEAVRLTSL